MGEGDRRCLDGWMDVWMYGMWEEWERKCRIPGDELESLNGIGNKRGRETRGRLS